MKRKLLFLATLVVSILGAKAQTDVTNDYITNADFSSTTGWTNYSGGGSEHSEGSGLIGTLNLNSRPSTTDATHLSTEYCFGFSARWNGRYTYYQQVLENVQAGAYTLSYDVQDVNSTSTKYNMDNHFYVQVGDTKYSDSATEWMNAGASAWTTHTISFTLNETSDVTISFGYGNKENKGSGDCPAIYVSHLKLEVFPFATSSDYGALNTAISAVEGKTWGFDADEYAPYNYVEVIQALASAQAIDQTANNSQATVQALTATLNTAMTANAAEVNAIYDGNFDDAKDNVSVNTLPKGWHGSDSNYSDGYWTRYLYSDGSSNVGLTHFANGSAMMSKSTPRYGLDDGYTMPLNGGTYYTLSFDYGGWNSELVTTVVVTKGEDQMTFVPSNKTETSIYAAQEATDRWKSYKGFFKTSNAGNYVLKLDKYEYNGNGGQVAYGAIVLKTTTVAEATAYYNTVKTSVEDDYDDSAYGGDEKTAFKNALDASMEGKTVAEIMEAAANLYTLRDAYNAAKPNYAKFVAEKTSAIAIGVTTETANAVTMSTKDDLETALQALYVLEDAAATSGYAVDATTLFGSWTTQNMDNASGQHWSDNASTSYFDKWSGSGFTSSITSTMTLPAGKYVFKVAGRAAANSINGAFNMSVKIGENDAVQKDFTAKGDTGYGIDTDGAVNYSDGGTYAYNGAGRGWEWRFIGFELDAEASVTMTAYAQIYAKNWVSFTDATLLTTSDNVGVLKNLLEAELTVANGISTTANVGTGAFQIPSSAVSTFEGAKTTAQGVYDNTDATSEQVSNAITALQTAEESYKNVELNAPADDARYRIKSTAATGASWKDKYYMLRPDALQANGGYSTKADVSAAEHLAIAWKFTAVTGGYTLSMTDANGATRYLCTNIKGYGQGSATQIRTTTDSEKALVVKVIAATGTDGRWFLQNTEDNSYLGGQDAGLFSNSQNYDLALEEASKASATLKITGAKWGTFIVPFNATIPEGVTAYTATSDGTSITLSDPITDSFAANTPYIVYSESPITKDDYEGWGTATQDSYTFGQLTGTYTRIFAPKDSYILQNNDNKVGFYLCDVADTYVVAKNRCYLTPSSSSNPVKAFILGDFADDIQTILSGNNDETKSDIYDLTGRKVNKVTKGIYIINGKKVMMK